MKKIWLYLAMPVALLNGCQHQQALLDEAESLSTELDEERDSEAEHLKEVGNVNLIEGDMAALAENDESECGMATGDKTVRIEINGEEAAAGEIAREVEDAAAGIWNHVGKLTNVILSQNFVKEAPFHGSTVSIAKSEKEEAAQVTKKEIEIMVREAAFDLDTVVKNGQTVVLKPNLVQMIVDSTGEKLDREVNGVTTDWRVVKAVLKMVRELNPDGKVYIMEGSATGPTRDVMDYFRYTDEYLEGVDGFICLEEDCGGWKDYDAREVVKVELPDGLLHKSYYFNRILYEADVVISIPALKTSSGVVVTAGIKNVSIGTPPGNLYGIAPGVPSKQRMVSHKITDGELDKWIYDYYKAKPVDYVIVDGLQGFQSGPVPMSSERRETDKMNMGLVLAGKDAVAVDTVCSLVMGWDPESVGYLNMFRERDGLGKPEDIRIKGVYADEVRKHFTIYREELGGIPVLEQTGPEFAGKAGIDGDRIDFHYETGVGARKLEVYVDGLFQMSRTVKGEGEEGDIHLTVPGLSLGEHQVSAAVYDRFLNKTVKKLK